MAGTVVSVCKKPRCNNCGACESEPQAFEANGSVISVSPISQAEFKAEVMRYIEWRIESEGAKL